MQQPQGLSWVYMRAQHRQLFLKQCFQNLLGCLSVPFSEAWPKQQCSGILLLVKRCHFPRSARRASIEIFMLSPMGHFTPNKRRRMAAPLSETDSKEHIALESMKRIRKWHICAWGKQDRGRHRLPFQGHICKALLKETAAHLSEETSNLKLTTSSFATSN